MVQVLLQFLKEIVYFPIWWYTRGFFLLALKMKDFLSNREKGLALFVWIKNIFRPMYGQRDFVGILISLLVRIVEIFFRSLLMLWWVIIALIIIILYLGFPILVVYQIIYQLN